MNFLQTKTLNFWKNCQFRPFEKTTTDQYQKKTDQWQIFFGHIRLEEWLIPIIFGFNKHPMLLYFSVFNQPKNFMELNQTLQGFHQFIKIVLLLFGTRTICFKYEVYFQTNFWWVMQAIFRANLFLISLIPPQPNLTFKDVARVTI